MIQISEVERYDTHITIDRAKIKQLIEYGCLSRGRDGKVLGISRVVDEALLWYITHRARIMRHPNGRY